VLCAAETSKLTPVVLLHRAYKQNWQAANARRADFVEVRNDGLVINPNLWGAPPATATLSQIEFSGQNRLFMRLDIPFAKASAVLFSIRLTSAELLTVGYQQVVLPGQYADIQLEFEPIVGTAGLEITTRVVDGGNTQWAWAYVRWPVIHGDTFQPIVGMPPLAQVLEGRDGWLFLDNDTNDSLAQTEGLVVADDTVCARWRDDVRAREEICSEIGAAFHLQIVPNKETVFPSLLPAHVKLADQRSVHKIIEAIARPSVSFPVDRLKQDAAFATYSQVDTHWTDYGAFVGSNDLLRNLSLQPLNVEDAIFQRVVSSGDLGTKLLHKRDGENAIGRLRYPKAQKVFDNLIRNHGRMWIFENPHIDGPTALLFGDSFNVLGAKWLAERFRRLIYLHSVSADEKIIRAEAPNVIIGEVVERFLIVPPDDLTSFSIEELWERKYRLMTPSDRNSVLNQMRETASLTGSDLPRRAIDTLRRVIAE
jgi:alginate O-acetyltransferase complex protein AlgJ